MIHIFTYFADIHKKEFYATCTCGLKLSSPLEETAKKFPKFHLEELKNREFSEHNLKITVDLLESYIRNGVKPPPFVDLVAERCVLCDTPDSEMPMHVGSPLCRSGGIAAGGTITHCNCKACYGG